MSCSSSTFFELTRSLPNVKKTWLALSLGAGGRLSCPYAPAMTISGRAYRHTATHYAYSSSVDWSSVPEAKDGEKGPVESI
ncbi:hypothetical protein [Desulfosporosinus sp. SB140]|uniref:hypothetical protein n=1 Tax=Desulfosporosinus paludis TaxID=3115649 RepID=UPI00388D7EE2